MRTDSLPNNHGVRQDKLEPSEQLGDLLKRAGDNEAALQCYQKAGITQKVVEGLAAKGDFAELTRFSGTQVRPPAPVAD